MKRLFIATPVVLDNQYDALVARLRHELRHDDIVWVQPEIRHLTLRFIGATPPDRVEGIREALRQVCAESQPFDLNLDKLGAFGSRYKPEVLWLGFEEFQPFRQLFDRLEPRLLELGAEPNYGNFVPHVTLCRVKGVVDKSRFWKRVDALTPAFAQSVPVSELTLFQSFLHKDGPEYKALLTCKLGE
ncbi:MAG: RNA 2',3'-cyclic phosphodiesterase [Bacteroidales bacterium]|nr:RNA 2',3'-cyclic phosphodiesterase [Bacteroidales bacterium]MCR4858065.1 RNA 2',3'-cyclic phosphodiesterase [Bacteroidales bacterium]